jgi:hypothetical protein
MRFLTSLVSDDALHLFLRDLIGNARSMNYTYGAGANHTHKQIVIVHGYSMSS